MLFEGITKQPPSLLDLCVRTAIDNVRYIGYVGGVDFQLLEQILQHCTLEQLKHIEDATHVRRFSPYELYNLLYVFDVFGNFKLCFFFVRIQILVLSLIIFGRDSMRNSMV